MHIVQVTHPVQYNLTGMLKDLQKRAEIDARGIRGMSMKVAMNLARLAEKVRHPDNE